MKAHQKFEELLFELSNDFTIYKQLFSEDSSVEILNNFNSLIFGNYQKNLVDRIFSEIAKALDPAHTGKSKDPNLSLAYFIKKYDLEEDEEVAKEFEHILKIYAGSNLKKYRNKILSHNDARLAYKGESISVKLQLSDVEVLIEGIGNLYYTILFKAGIKDENFAMDPLVTLPFDKDGYAFLNKLNQHVTRQGNG
jgi:hypothetical protein